MKKIFVMFGCVLIIGMLFTGCVSTGLKGHTGFVTTSGITECQLFVPPTLTVVQFDGEPVRWPSNTLVDVTAGRHTVVCDYYWYSNGHRESADGLAATENFVAGQRYSVVKQQSGNKIGIVLNANYGYTSNVVPKQGESLLIIETIDSDFNQYDTAVYMDGKFAFYLLKFQGEKSYYIVPNGNHTIGIKGDTLKFVAESEKIHFNAKRGARIFWLMIMIPITTSYSGITISGREPL
jgi:hypothetical protein